MKTARKNAFTLIELLVVIAIIGVLAAVVLVAINPAKRMAQARDSGRKSDIGQIATALQAYYTTFGSYPSALPSLTGSGDLKQIPNDATGGSYLYTTNLTEAAVYKGLESPTTSAGSWVWCWRSTSGVAAEITGTTCTSF